MYFRQTVCLVEILRRPRDVVMTVVSRLRARWKIFRSATGVTVTGTAKRPPGIEKKLENDALFVASLVSGIIEDAFPGKQVTVKARLEGDPQAALKFLRGRFE